MGALEEQARFLTAKYGTAAGPTGFDHHRSVALSFDAASIMVIVGLLIFAAVLYMMIKEYQMQKEAQRIREKYYHVQ